MGIVRFPRPPTTLTPDLKRAAEYRVGHGLTDLEAVTVIDAEIDAVVVRLSRLGACIARVGAWAPRVRPLGYPSGWRNSAQKHQQSVAMRASWARRKAQAQTKEA